MSRFPIRESIFRNKSLRSWRDLCVSPPLPCFLFRFLALRCVCPTPSQPLIFSVSPNFYCFVPSECQSPATLGSLRDAAVYIGRSGNSRTMGYASLGELTFETVWGRA